MPLEQSPFHPEPDDEHQPVDDAETTALTTEKLKAIREEYAQGAMAEYRKKIGKDGKVDPCILRYWQRANKSGD